MTMKNGILQLKYVSEYVGFNVPLEGHFGGQFFAG